MGVAGGPKIETDGLVFAIDSDSNVRGYTKYGTSGTNNNHRAIRNLVDRSSTYSLANTSQLTGGVTYYTLYGITYPEGNYTPAARDGITPGFENITAAKTYDASRDVNYYVFDEDTNTWVADSYFNGLRISGHCYDTYSSTNRAAEHARFQSDFDNIKRAFPNATHIVIGSHASEWVDDDANTVTRLKEIGLPDDAVGLGRVEFVLVGKVNKPWTHHYVRENVNSAVANMVVGLPLEGKGGAIVFDGTDDYIELDPSVIPAGNEISISFWNNGNSFASSTIIAASLNNSDQTLNIHLPWSNKNIYWDCGYPFNRIQKLATDAEILGWHNWVFTKNATTGNMSIYLDGALWHSGSGLTSSIPSMNVARIGSYFNNTLYHNGKIAQCLIYNQALSQEEILQNYNTYKNRFNI